MKRNMSFVSVSENQATKVDYTAFVLANVCAVIQVDIGILLPHWRLVVMAKP